MDPVYLDIPNGAPCIVEPVGLGERFKSVFLGWEEGRYCILKPPVLATQLEQLVPEKPCIVRYLDCKGVLRGFRTEVQALANRPHRLLFIDYPRIVESLSVRKQDRVDCFLPARLTLDQAEVSGHIVNISAGGFRFSKREETGDRGLADLEEMPITCAFSVIGDPVRDYEVQGEVRQVAFQDHKVIVKAEFSNLDSQVRTALEQFVAEVSDHLNPACSADSLDG